MSHPPSDGASPGPSAEPVEVRGMWEPSLYIAGKKAAARVSGPKPYRVVLSSLSGIDLDAFTVDDLAHATIASVTIQYSSNPGLHIMARPALEPHHFVELTLPRFGRAGMIYLSITMDYRRWNYPFDSVTWLAHLDRHQKELQGHLSSFFDHIDYRADIPNLQIPVGEMLKRMVSELEAVVQRAFDDAYSDVRPDALVTHFTFAPEFRTACQQYLMYFAQFLKDLTDEDATVELTDEAGAVLFAVTPKNGEEALATVREALSIYLALPVNPDVAQLGAHSVDRAMLELLGEVRQLQSKLMFAAAGIQDRDEQIQHLRYENQQLLALANAVAHSRSAMPDTEPVLGEIVSAGKFEKWGISLDLAALARRLKRKRPTVPPAEHTALPSRGPDRSE